MSQHLRGVISWNGYRQTRFQKNVKFAKPEIATTVTMLVKGGIYPERIPSCFSAKGCPKQLRGYNARSTPSTKSWKHYKEKLGGTKAPLCNGGCHRR